MREAGTGKTRTDGALREVTRALVDARDVPAVMRRISELVLAGAEVTGVHLERVDFERGEVEVVAAAGDAAPVLGARIPYPGSLAAEVIERNESEIVGPAELARRSVAGTLSGPCQRCTALVVPLISEGTAVGAMILFRPGERSPFSGAEIARTRALADLAALALRRVLLQDDVARGLRSLEESEQRFQLLVQSVKDYAIFMLDPQGHIVSWNEGAQRIKGYSESEVLGRHFSLFYTAADRERDHPADELSAAEREGVYCEEGWRVRKDGSRFWAHVTLTAMRNSEGARVGFAKVTRDLSERHLAERERETLLERERAARLEAERANRAKSQFLSTMSHELRTPINAIMGYTELLAGGVVGPVSDAQRAYLERVRSSSRHLLSLIGDVLDVARIEAGRIEIHSQPLRSDLAVRTALTLVQPQADAKGLELVNACIPDREAVLRADPDRLQQILVNLLGNAVKFTERGGRITVTCGLVDQPAHGAALEGTGPWMRIRIEDTGVGIPPERLDRIWEPFEQAESGHARSKEGAGLGLTISRSLARLMGGDLVAHSEPGAGSVFLLFLPGVEGAELGGGQEGKDRRDRSRGTPGISVVGSAVLGEVEHILQDYLARLREDPEVPSARRMTESALEDHVATLLVDIAEALAAIEEAAGAASPLVRDAQTIQQLLAEKHGQRRARSGWSPAEVRRDFEILREELERAVRRRVEREQDGEATAADETAVRHGLELFAKFLDQAERTSLEEMKRT